MAISEEMAPLSSAGIPRTNSDLETALSSHTTLDPHLSKMWGKIIFELAEIGLVHTGINFPDSGCKDLRCFQMSWVM